MHSKGQSVNYAFNRKVAKDHGEGGNIVGTPLNGRIIVIDDVITAGTAIRESADIISKNSAQLSGVLIAIDRQEKGKDTDLSAIQQVEQDFSIPVVSIVTLSDIIEYLKEAGGYEQALSDMLEYRKTWGIQGASTNK